MNIVVLGPPGVGKGTQAKGLETRLLLPHIATGDIFRAIQREDTPLAHKVRTYMDNGQYVPDDLTIELVLDRLGRPDATAGFVLDGFPRTGSQARALDAALKMHGDKVDRGVYIHADKDCLTDRLKRRIICPFCRAIYNAVSVPPRQSNLCDVCGHELERRTDEAPDVVERRLETFIRETAPLVEYYRAQGVLVEIDGSKTVDEVEAQVDSSMVEAAAHP